MNLLDLTPEQWTDLGISLAILLLTVFIGGRLINFLLKRVLKRLFERAAWAMFSLLTDVGKVRPARETVVRIQGPDREALLARWLSELNFLHTTGGRLFSRFDIAELSQKTLTAQVFGEKIDPQRHPIYTEIKAVTFHGLRIAEETEGLRASVVSYAARASAGRSIAISMSPSNSLAGSTSPGVTGCFSVPASIVAAAVIVSRPASWSPSSNWSHARADSRWISTWVPQYGLASATSARSSASRSRSVRAWSKRPLRAAPSARPK